MRLYQILTGSCQNKFGTLSKGIFKRFIFFAYSTEHEVIICNKNSVVLQVITFHETKVNCLSCSTLDGSIAIGLEYKTVVYRPTILHEKESYSTLKWIEINKIDSVDKGGVTHLQWLNHQSLIRSNHLISIENGIMLRIYSTSYASQSIELEFTAQLDYPTKLISSSNDGRYFSTVHLIHPNEKEATELIIWKMTYPFKEKTTWVYTRIYHKDPIQSLVWRENSKYMPKEWFPNAFLTTDLSGTTRIWVEQGAPDCQSKSSLDNFSNLMWTINDQLKIPLPSTLLQHPVLRCLFQLWRNDQLEELGFENTEESPTTPSSLNASFYFVGSINKIPEISSIPNDKMLPKINWLNNKRFQLDLKMESLLEETLKEIERVELKVDLDTFSLFNQDHGDDPKEKGKLTDSLVKPLAKFIQRALALYNEWSQSNDVVFSILPTDGSIILWSIQNLDKSTVIPSHFKSHNSLIIEKTANIDQLKEEIIMNNFSYPSGSIQQIKQVLLSRISKAFKGFSTISSSLCDLIIFESHLSTPNASTFYGEDISLITTHDTNSICLASQLCKLLTLKMASQNVFNFAKSSEDLFIARDILQKQFEHIELKILATTNKVSSPLNVTIIASQLNGSINSWIVGLSDESKFPNVLCVDKVSELNGHNYPCTQVYSHPTLPIMMSVGEFTKSRQELIVWEVDSIGPLSGQWVDDKIGTIPNNSSPSIKELIRLRTDDFPMTQITWIPALISGSPRSFSNSIIYNELPMTLFIASTGASVLRAFLVLPKIPSHLKGDFLVELNEYYKNNNSPVLIKETGTSGAVILLDKEFPDSNLHNTDEYELVSMNTLPVSLNSNDYHLYRIFTEKTSKKSFIETWKITIDHDILQSFQSTGAEISQEYVSLFQHFNRILVSVDKLVDRQLLSPDEIIHVDPISENNGQSLIRDVEIKLPYHFASIHRDPMSRETCLKFWIFKHESYWEESSNDNWQYDKKPICINFRESLKNHLYNAKTEQLYSKNPVIAQTNKLIKDPESRMTVLNMKFANIGRLAVTILLDSDHVEMRRIQLKSGDNFELMNTVIVAIFESESTGGFEWLLEDKLDLSVEIAKYHYFNELKEALDMTKSDVVIDWISSENGSYLLSVLIFKQVFAIYAPTCKEINESYKDAHSDEKSNETSLSSAEKIVAIGPGVGNTLMSSIGEVSICWIRLRKCILKNFHSSLDSRDRDGNHHFMTWSKNGIAIISTGYELLIYSQWAGDYVAKFKKEAFGNKAKYLDKLSKENLKSFITTKNIELGVASSSIDFYGLFEASQHLHPILPQFHPRQLLEWMNFGKIHYVKAILSHLTKCLMALNYRNKNTEHGKLKHFANKCLTVDSSCENASSLSNDMIPSLPIYVLRSLDDLILNGNLSYDEMKPKPNTDTLLQDDEIDLAAMISADELELPEVSFENEAPSAKRDGFKTRSKTMDVADSANAIDYYENVTLQSRRKSSILNLECMVKLINFTELDYQRLVEYLTKTQLQKLSSLDQMYLLGIAELMVTMNTDSINKLIETVNVDSVMRENEEETYNSSKLSTNQGLDECGIRFIMIMQLYSYLCRTLPPAKTQKLKKSGLSTSSIIWAFHSESKQEILTQLLVRPQSVSNYSTRNDDQSFLNWATFKQYGCVWWIRSDQMLKTYAEKIARNEFQANKSPMEAAIFYLAMKKAKIVAGLCKIVCDKKLEDFFRSDFSPGSSACKQAEKNAYRLLSLRKFDQAAALFLLAGRLKDAINICLNSLNDIQMAVLISRLYTSDGTNSNYNTLLNDHILSSPDPFIRSICYWNLGNYLKSLETLLETSDQSCNDYNAHCIDAESNVNVSRNVSPSVFKFYTFLSRHPLVLRQKKIDFDSSASLDQLYNLERRLYFRTAHHYSIMGFPVLSLDVLSKVTNMKMKPAKRDQKKDAESKVAKPETKPTIEDDIFDFGADINIRMPDDELKLDWSSTSPINEDILIEPEASSHPEDPGEIISMDNNTDHIDTMTLHSQFMSCLRIMGEELSALSFEKIGGANLRMNLYIWLENELTKLVEIISTDNDALAKANDLNSLKEALGEFLTEEADEKFKIQIINEISRFGPLTCPSFDSHNPQGFLYLSKFPTLNIVNLNGKTILNAIEVWRLKRKREWIKKHDPMLRRLMSFCSLNDSSHLSLNAIKIELIYLLSESESLGKCENNDDTEKTLLLNVLNSIPLFSTHLQPLSTLHIPSRPIEIVKGILRDLVTTLEHLDPPFINYQQIPKWANTLSANNAEAKDEYKALKEIRLKKIELLKKASVSLSECLFQCLSTGSLFISDDRLDEDQKCVNLPVLATPIAVTLMSRKSSNIASLRPNTEPAKWPGLRITHNEFPDTMRSLKCLLVESLAVIYTSLLNYSLQVRDESLLYKILAKNLNTAFWYQVFGGGHRTKPNLPPPIPQPFRPPTVAEVNKGPVRAPPKPPPPKISSSSSRDKARNAAEISSHQTSYDEENKSRFRLLTNVLQTSAHALEEDIKTKKEDINKSDYPDEWFIPPETSIIHEIFRKPKALKEIGDIYESDNEDLPKGYYSLEMAKQKAQQRERNKNRYRLRILLDEKIQEMAKAKTRLKQKIDAIRQAEDKKNKFLGRNDEEDDEENIHRRFEKYYSKAHENKQQSEEEPVDVKQEVLNKLRETKQEWAIVSTCRNTDYFEILNEIYSNNNDEKSDEVLLSEFNNDEIKMKKALIDLEEVEDLTDIDYADSIHLNVKSNNVPSVEESNYQWESSDSYAWRVIRLLSVERAIKQLNHLCLTLCLEQSEISKYCSNYSKCLRLLEKWRHGYTNALFAPNLSRKDCTLSESVKQYLPPVNFIPSLERIDTLTSDISRFMSIAMAKQKAHSNQGPSVERVEKTAILEYLKVNNKNMNSNEVRCILETMDKFKEHSSFSIPALRGLLRLAHLSNPNNTPFLTSYPNSLRVKRVWYFLSKYSSVENLMMQLTFKKPSLAKQFPLRESPYITFTSTAIEAAEKTSKKLDDIEAPAPHDDNSLDEIGKKLKQIFMPFDSETPNTKGSHSNFVRLHIPIGEAVIHDDLKIIHKEIDPLITMCLNQNNMSKIAIGTTKEIIELDIRHLIFQSSWNQNDVCFDAECLYNPLNDKLGMNNLDFIVPEFKSIRTNSHFEIGAGKLKRTIKDVQKLTVHHNLPYYLCGTNAGSVHILQWGVSEPVLNNICNTYLTSDYITGNYQSVSGPSGRNGPKITSMNFDYSGNRFAVGDVSGNLGLWNLTLGARYKPPYYAINCHGKSLLDFEFLGNSSLIFTVGSGSEDNTTSSGYNAAYWDVLLPPNKALIRKFYDQPLDSTCTCVARVLKYGYSEDSSWQNRIVIGNRRGEVIFIDLRGTMGVYSQFLAHPNATVKSIKVDPISDSFITTGTDGLLKIWRLSDLELLGIFKTDGQGSTGITHLNQPIANNLQSDVGRPQNAASLAASALFRGTGGPGIGVSEIALLPPFSISNYHISSNINQQINRCLSESLPNDDRYMFSTCRFLTCDSDGALRLRNIMPSPKIDFSKFD